ncbi:hypothetical protein GWI33_015201 [Rhynchophorus ferrugineus]|uniref:Mos1 transposase HTH domain-containing protein n=1 Tax=Rhynchophorus ferrugineus TaxID=354439 RepID=A0A834M9Z4_RHYFE|nr:hypothetical protein GWI33_015201 [Rhynchophorus ferrugineus]
MDKKEFRVLIKYCFLKGKNIVEARTCLNAESPDTAPGKSTIKDWNDHLVPSDYFLFSDLYRMFAGKKFSLNEEVITETEAYFEAKDKSYYKNGIEKLEDCYNQCITLEGNYVE